jgi:hypothetical protein
MAACRFNWRHEVVRAQQILSNLSASLNSEQEGTAVVTSPSDGAPPALPTQASAQASGVI